MRPRRAKMGFMLKQTYFTLKLILRPVFFLFLVTRSLAKKLFIGGGEKNKNKKEFFLLIFFARHSQQ